MECIFKHFKITFAAFIAVLLASVSPSVFSDANANEEEATEIATEDCKLKKYTNPEVMAAAMADPAKFMEFLAIFHDPQVPVRALNTCLDQEQFNQIMANMSNPQYMMNASAQFMNPYMYMNWMTAMMNPAFYTSVMNTYMNPQLYMNYMAAMMNPAYYMQFADPKLAENATSMMMDPSSFQNMFTAWYPTQQTASAQ